MASADLLATVQPARSPRRRVALVIAAGVAVGIGSAALLATRPALTARLLGRTVVALGMTDDRGTGAVAELSPPAGANPRGATPGAAGAPLPDAAAAAVAAAPAQTNDRARPLQPRRVSDWLGEIAAAAGRGLIVAPEVDGIGQVSAVFDDATAWQERLAALARVHGFHYAVGDRLIEAWVRPRVPETIPPGQETAEEEPQPPVTGPPPLAAAPLAAEPATAAYVLRPAHARAADMVAALSKAARVGRVQVAADPGSNAVVIAGEQSAADEIAELARALDVPRRRFVLEAEIVELSRTARRELGVQWSIDGTVAADIDFPAADTPGEGAGIIVATDGAHTLRARIGALEADGQVHIVSRPRVVVLEGRPASIESVRILRVRFPDRAAVVGEIDKGGVGGERAVEEIPVGVTLRVEPSMQADGRIVLRIRAKSSTLGPPQPPDGIPEELSRMVDAEVAVADGETAVLGGLLREGNNRSGAGVPFLRSVPILGLLLGKRAHDDDSEELVVLVTPHLLS
jgi:Bacterial type II and III secretion system protein/Bacterial type II/III secretion system short domain